MPKHLKNVLLVFLLSSACLIAKDKPKGDSVMPDVTARGRALYEYDQAAWHATDAVQALHPAPQSVGRYIARKSTTGWTVEFGHLNDQHDAFLVAYEATQGVGRDDFMAKRIDPPAEDRLFYLSAAKAIDLALGDFRRENRPYNVAVLPAEFGQLWIYVIPAQTSVNIYPLGGDVRYLVTPDGSTIVNKRQMHKSIIENRGQLPEGSRPAGGYHTHVLSDVPEDTDVFYVLTRKPAMPEMIATQKKKLYEISPDGTIREGKL